MKDLKGATRMSSKDYRKKYRDEFEPIIHAKRLMYKIPNKPNMTKIPEKELSWIVSCAITQKFAIKTMEEVQLTKSSRIDIYIPSHQIGIEVKINGRRSKGSRRGETPYQQLARYRRCKMIKIAYLVSLDGSIGYNIEELLVKLERDLRVR
jgi:hypothetical protein